MKSEPSPIWIEAWIVSHLLVMVLLVNQLWYESWWESFNWHLNKWRKKWGQIRLQLIAGCTWNIEMGKENEKDISFPFHYWVWNRIINENRDKKFILIKTITNICKNFDSFLSFDFVIHFTSHSYSIHISAYQSHRECKLNM